MYAPATTCAATGGTTRRSLPGDAPAHGVPMIAMRRYVASLDGPRPRSAAAWSAFAIYGEGVLTNVLMKDALIAGASGAR